MRDLSQYAGYEIVQYAIKNNCSRKVYDLLTEKFTDTVNIYFND